MQTAPTFVQQFPVAAPHRTVPVKATRVLGILQLVIGALTCIFGIAVAATLNYWAGNIGFGIWGGVWILVAGILGVLSAANPTNYCLNGTNMAFAIVSSVVAFGQFIVYCVAVSTFRNYNSCYYTYSYYGRYVCTSSNSATGTALYAILLMAMIAEFAVSLTVAIYCCKYGCSCCDSSSQGVVVQQGVPQNAFVQSSGMTYNMQPTVVSMPVSGNYTSYPGQQVQQQVMHTTTSGYAQPANPTAMTYGQGPAQFSAPAGAGQVPAQFSAPAGAGQGPGEFSAPAGAYTNEALPLYTSK